MTAPGNSVLVVFLTLSIVVSSAYAVGRIHQWHRHGVERDEAYRIGYDKASRSIIDMMAAHHRSSSGRVTGTRSEPTSALATADSRHAGNTPRRTPAIAPGIVDDMRCPATPSYLNRSIGPAPGRRSARLATSEPPAGERHSPACPH